MTNFKTIKETKEAIKKVCEDNLEDLGELYNIFQMITKGHDPAKEIKFEQIYKDKYINQKYGYVGLVDRVQGAANLIEEYREDINTLEGRGQKDIDEETDEILAIEKELGHDPDTL